MPDRTDLHPPRSAGLREAAGIVFGMLVGYQADGDADFGARSALLGARARLHAAAEMAEQEEAAVAEAERSEDDA